MKVPMGWVSGRVLLPACGWFSSHWVSPHMAEREREKEIERVRSFCSYMAMFLWNNGPMLMTPFNLNYLLKSVSV